MTYKSKQEKKETAIARQEVSAGLTAEQRIASLDKTFGKGKGAAKERAKLAVKLEKEKK